MKNCESCSMPMIEEEDFGGADASCKYCKYCAPKGILKSKEEIRDGWIKAVMKMDNLSNEEAAKKVDTIMPKMSAWKES